MTTTEFEPNPDAWYTLTFAHSRLLLTVEDAATEAFAELIQAGPSAPMGGPHQQWRFRPVGDGWYRLHVRHSIGVMQTNDSDARLRQGYYVNADSAAHHWRIEAVEGGIQLFSRASGKAVNVNSKKTFGGANVVSYGENDRPNRRLVVREVPAAQAFTPEPGASYMLICASSGKALDVEGLGLDDRDNVHQWTPHEHLNQLWTFEHVEDGWHIIRSRNSGLVLDATSADNVFQFSLHGEDNQQWKLIPHVDGYELRNRRGGRSLQVSGEALSDGANFEVDAPSARRSQRLHVRRIADPLPDIAPRALDMRAGDEAIKLPPLEVSTLTDGRDTTIEMWVRPRATGNHEPIFWLGNDGRALTIQHLDEGVVVKVRDSERVQDLFTVEDALPTWKWRHLALRVNRTYQSVGAAGRQPAYSVKLYVDGVERASKTYRRSPDSGSLIFDLMAAPRMSELGIGGRPGGSSVFTGLLAEVRIWKCARDPVAIARDHRRRACGSEPELAACYRLDEAEGERLLDLGPARAHALIGEGNHFTAKTPPPLSPTQSWRSLGRVEARTRLTREWLPTAAFSRSILNKLTRLEALLDKDSLSVADLGPTSGDRVEAKVYEVVLDSLDPGGKPRAGGFIQVRCAERLILIEEQAGTPTLRILEPGWQALPSTGASLRLRLLADGLTSPILCVRHAGMHDDVWTTVAPDANNFQAMLNTDSLLTPSDGRASPLRDAGDAARVATMVQGLARPGVPYESLVAQSGGGNGGGIDRFFKKIYKELVDAAEDVAAGASSLLDDADTLWKGTVDAVDLVAGSIDSLVDELEDAADVVVRQGGDAIVKGIASANQLGVVSSSLEEFVNVVQLVGKSIVDGVTTYWKIAVDTIEDAMTAMGALFKRLGADVGTFIDNLAAMFDFDWAALLARSDQIYSEVLDSLDGAAAALDGAESPFAGVGASLASFCDSADSNRSLRELTGLSFEQPKLGELEVLLDFLGKILRSADLSLPMPDLGVEFPDFADSIVELADDVPGMLSDPQKLVDDPIRPLFAFMRDSWSTIGGALDDLLELASGALASFIDQIKSFLEAKIDLGWHTDIFAETIASSDGTTRELNLLRLVSLIAAVPAAFGGGQGGDDSALQGAIVGFGLVNAAISLIRSLSTVWDEVWSKASTVMSVLHGVTMTIQGALQVATKETAQVEAGIVNLVYGPLVGLHALASEVAKDPVLERSLIVAGMVLDVACGGAYIGTSTAPIVDGLYWGFSWVFCGVQSMLEFVYGDFGEMPFPAQVGHGLMSFANFDVNLFYLGYAGATA